MRRTSKAEPVPQPRPIRAVPARESAEGFAPEDLSRSFVEVIPRSMWSIRYAMREAAGAELTVPQFRCLAMMSRRPRTNGDLAENMGVSVPAMSRMIDGLVQEGYVVRVPQEHDRRQVNLELSLPGRRKFEKMRKQTHELFRGKFEGLAEDKRRRLREGLEVLREIFG
jgi:DNA-binding MarR family transcriptional regulator